MGFFPASSDHIFHFRWLCKHSLHHYDGPGEFVVLSWPLHIDQIKKEQRNHFGVKTRGFTLYDTGIQERSHLCYDVRFLHVAWINLPPYFHYAHGLSIACICACLKLSCRVHVLQVGKCNRRKRSLLYGGGGGWLCFPKLWRGNTETREIYWLLLWFYVSAFSQERLAALSFRFSRNHAVHISTVVASGITRSPPTFGQCTKWSVYLWSQWRCLVALPQWERSVFLVFAKKETAFVRFLSV